MKIYFNASLAGREKYQADFDSIVAICQQLGHQVIYQHMQRDYRQVNQQSRSEHERDFQQAKAEIKSADVMLVEASYPSIGVGHLLTLALQMYKPILVLDQNTPHGLLIGDLNRLITIRKYIKTDKNNTKTIINSFIKKSKSKLLQKRFNFMLTINQDSFLDGISQQQNISKANYIRRLIDKNIDENQGNK